nr:hypothetical protein [Tanacetum cinerariifolium]
MRFYHTILLELVSIHIELSWNLLQVDALFALALMDFHELVLAGDVLSIGGVSQCLELSLGEEDLLTLDVPALKNSSYKGPNRRSNSCCDGTDVSPFVVGGRATEVSETEPIVSVIFELQTRSGGYGNGWKRYEDGGESLKNVVENGGGDGGLKGCLDPTDNGTEFKNQVLKEYFDSVGISHQMSSVQTPQQNRVVEHRNQTLVEAARTMLIFLVHRYSYGLKRLLLHISFLHVFGDLCYPKNDCEDIGKLGAKGDIGFFIGYSVNACAYRIYNRRTKKIIETMNVSFDELSAMAFEQRSSKPRI